MNIGKYYLLLSLLFGYCSQSFSQNSIKTSELIDSVLLNDSLAEYYYGIGDISKAQDYALKNVAINNHWGKNSVPHAISIMKLSRYYVPEEKDEEKRNSLYGLSILKDSLGVKSPTFIKYLLEYAWRLYNYNQVNEACKIIQEASEEKYDGDEIYLGYLYYSYGHFLKDANYIELAKKYAHKAELSFIEQNRLSDDYYAKTLIDLSLLSVPNFDESVNYLIKAKKTIDDYKGKESIDYLNVLLDLSYIYRSHHNLDMALEFAQQAKYIGFKIKDKDFSSYLYTLYYLSNIYSNMKQYNEAIANAEECLTLMKEKKEIAIDERLPTLDSLVSFNWNASNIEKTNLYAKEAYLIRKSSNVSGEEMVSNLFYLIHSNYYLKKYEECVKNVKEIQDIYGDQYSSGYRHYFDDMEVLMNSYFNLKLYNDALDVSNELLTTHKRLFGENRGLANLLSYQAVIYSYLGDYDKYHEYSLKSLDIYKKIYGEYSPEYLYKQSDIANGFYEIGFEDSYSLLKKSACIAYDVYGKMHLKFIQDFFTAMILWTNYRDEFLDNYKLDDFYRFLQFQRIICNFNHRKQNLWEKISTVYELYVQASLPSILQKYDKDAISIEAIYNSLLLLKSRQPKINDIQSQIKKEIGAGFDNEFDNFCTTNNDYIKCTATYTNPERMDSLYVVSNQYINVLKTKSPTFLEFTNNIITTNYLRDNLKSDEAVIDYLCLKRTGDGNEDFLVVIDRKRDCPNFIPVKNAHEQIKQICSSYDLSFFIIENDSILSTLKIDVSKINCITGYDLSIDYIINRNHKSQERRQINDKIQEEIHANAFTSAYDEFERGVNQYKKKEYEKAMRSFYLSDSLMYVAKGEESNYFGHGKNWIASCLHKMGNDSIAQMYSQYYYLPPIDMRQTILSDSVLDVASNLYNSGNMKEALEKYIEASKIEKKNLGTIFWYANTISRCAEICNELEDYDKAIVFEKEALKIREKSPGKNHIDYYWSLKNLYRSYSALNSIEEENKYGSLMTAFMETHTDLLGNEFFYYPVFTSLLGISNLNNDKYNEANIYLTKSVETVDILKGYTEIYMNILHTIIMGFGVLGKDSISFELCKKIIPLYEESPKEQINLNEYFDILMYYANHYYDQGDYITACVYQEKAINIIEKKDSVLYGVALSNIALTYCELGRIDEAIKIAEKALILTDSISSAKEYAERQINLAHCFATANNSKEALRYGKKSFDLLNKSYGMDDHQTLVAANNLATYYNDLGYYDEAGNLLLSVVKHAEKDVQTNGKILATTYNNLGMEWARNNLDFRLSLEYVSKGYELRKTILGERNLSTIESLYNKGRCLLDLEDISEGVSCIRKALDQTRLLLGENNLRYVEMMRILPIIYSKAGKYKRALNIEEERFELLKGIVSEKHISYIKALEDLSELYYLANDTIKLFNTIRSTYNKYRDMIISDFSKYTSIERASIVNGMGSFFDWLFPLVCYYKQEPELCSECYNALLLRKGILLNSEIEFGRLIRESGNSLLISQYEKLVTNRSLLNRQYQLPTDQRIINLDSLKHVLYETEDYLVSASKEYGDYTKRFKTNWKNIRDVLKDGELSVEFVNFYDTCAIQNRIYYALIIDKYSKTPELVPLCMEYQIHDVMKSDNTGGLYRLIWNPILQKCKDVNTLFFSPAGILNNIGIEYVDINEHENISDKYALYRLSSTREIIEKKESVCKNAALYGGLEYSVDTNILLAQNLRSGGGASSSVMYRGLSDSLSARNSFEPLYNTKTEIVEIEKALKKGNVKVSMYRDTFGTEESFKALSGKRINLIHLATHGMYIGASEAESRKRESNLSFIQLEENGRGQIQEDKSLSRSFLVMSGGDMLPSRKEVPDNLEDGILTASEISKLDLRGLDLVVLSACQTALGDVDNEGVYGLQRGFKKAGAKTILMSLDKVDDEATKLLMVEFYKNLMAGNSKYQSLKRAQKHLRQVGNGKYNKPEYWASFILLDGLN